MTSKTISRLLVVSTIVLFSGCSEKECKPTTVYVDREVRVEVPIKCHPPDVQCEFSGVGSEPIVKMLECIADQKRALEVCK